jgi:hypothetical protein
VASSTWTEFWTWFPRIVAIVSLAYNAKFVRDIKRLSRHVVSPRQSRAEPLGLNSGYRGLICLVSAPLDKNPKKQPPYIESLIEQAAILSDNATSIELRDSPIGAILKALELHRRDLKDCWFLSSKESKPYFEVLSKACARYFPKVRCHDPVEVSDVYEKIDEVYDAAHRLYGRLEGESNGEVKPHEVVVDITGGTKIMSIAVALACLDSDRQIQYLEQKERTKFYKIDITYEKISKRPAPDLP